MQTGRKDYIRLFEKLDKMESFDETELKRMRLRNLSYTKNYLFQFILKSLDHYDEEKEQDPQYGIRNVERLYERQMYDSALKHADKLEELAQERELFVQWGAILELKLEILKATQRTKGLPDQIDHINKLLREVEEKHRNLFDLKQLYYEIFLLSRTKFIARGEIDVQLITKLRDHPLMSTEANALSERARLQFYQNAYVADLYLADYVGAKKNADKMMEILGEHAFLRESSEITFVNVLSILAALSIQKGEYEKAWEFLEQLKDFEAKSVHTQVEHFDKYYAMLISYAMETGNVNLISGMMPEIESGLERFKAMLPDARLILFHWVLAKYFFVINDLPNAARWCKSLLDFKNTESRTDIQCIGRILNLIITFERGESELLDHYLKSTRRFLLSRKRMFRFEERFLKMMGALNETADTSRQNEILRSFRMDLQEILDDHFEKQILFYFEIEKWLLSRINGTSYLEEISQEVPED